MAATSLHAVRLYRMDLPDHPCPWGLRALRLLQEQHIPFEDHRLTSAEEVEAFKAAHGVATTSQVFAGDERIGGYSELAARLVCRPGNLRAKSLEFFQDRVGRGSPHKRNCGVSVQGARRIAKHQHPHALITKRVQSPCLITAASGIWQQ
ncbi:MAG: hypothetical protein ACKO5M_12690 [Vulcanococcus sp.]